MTSKAKQPDLENVPEAQVSFVDMEVKNKEAAIAAAKLAFLAKDKGDVNHWKDCAQMIKEDFDKRLGPTWHCVVGTSFGSIAGAVP